MAQRVAQKSSAVPELWARCLLGHCYGLWFLYLPTHVRAAPAKLRALQLAYDVLRKMEQHKVVLPDEVGQGPAPDPPGKGDLLLEWGVLESPRLEVSEGNVWCCVQFSGQEGHGRAGACPEKGKGLE